MFLVYSHRKNINEIIFIIELHINANVYFDYKKVCLFEGLNISQIKKIAVKLCESGAKYKMQTSYNAFDTAFLHSFSVLRIQCAYVHCMFMLIFFQFLLKTVYKSHVSLELALVKNASRSDGCEMKENRKNVTLSTLLEKFYIMVSKLNIYN